MKPVYIVLCLVICLLPHIVQGQPTMLLRENDFIEQPDSVLSTIDADKKKTITDGELGDLHVFKDARFLEEWVENGTLSIDGTTFFLGNTLPIKYDKKYLDEGETVTLYTKFNNIYYLENSLSFADRFDRLPKWKWLAISGFTTLCTWTYERINYSMYNDTSDSDDASNYKQTTINARYFGGALFGWAVYETIMYVKNH